MKTSSLLLLCAYLILFAPLNAFSQEFEKDFDLLLKAQFPSSEMGGVALVAQEGKVLYKKAFGKANLELNLPMKTDAVFRIGSNTKQFTASAILKLAEEGKLSLKDEITKYIPDFPTHGTRITIEHLLTHTSGIKNYTGISKWTNDLKRKDLTPKELIDLFKNEPLDFVPGQQYRYDNSGYILLGYIIEQVSGMSYAQYIQDAFFKPIGMKNSYYDDPSTVIANRIEGYKYKNGHAENADFLSMTLPYAAGSLLSTVDDMLMWYEALMNGKVLNNESLEKAHTSFILPNGIPTGYGYGWQIGNVQGSKSIKHTGVVNGFVTYVAYLPAEKVFVAIFSNSEAAGNLDGPASKMAALVLSKPYLWHPITLTEQTLDTYQGIYNTKYEGEKVIASQDGQLYFYTKGGPKPLLVPYAQDKFYIDNTLTSLTFNKNSKGKITGFELASTDLNDKAIRTDDVVKAIKEISVPAQTLKLYEGRYQFSPNFILNITLEDGKLYGVVGKDKKELVPFESDKFFTRSFDATIVFNADVKGHITGLTKIQNSEMTAQKIKE